MSKPFKIIRLKETPSTNDYAFLLEDGAIEGPLTAVVADHQTKGKGQRGNLWESERGKNHLKYIKSNAAKLTETAIARPALLRLMCARKLLKAEDVEAYFACAQKAGKKNTEAIALLLDYQQNKLTSKEKEKAAAKTEAKEEKVVDFVFSATAAEELQGKTFVVTGKLNTMTREEFKACLDACGAILSETLNSDTDYLITNTPSSGSAKNRKAEALGVKKLSEAEFYKMIGREE